MRMKSSILRLKVVILCGILLAYCSCGGGFDSDSDNVLQYQNAIFGTDTLGE